MKASLKGKYDLDKNGAAATIGVSAGELKLRASITDGTVVKGPSMNGLVLAVEKPGFFIVDYNVPKKDFRFQFMNSVRIAEKRLNMTYIHSQGDNRTILEGALVIDPANKLSANYLLGPGNCKLKYTYVHRGVTTFEPSYDLSKNAWDFAVARNVYGDDVLKATYQTTSKALGLEWSRNTNLNGCFKISASLNLNEESKVPKLTAESTWNFDM
ncbi:outer envelope pore protein 24A, chloroplastic [Rhodamnia argentea]|uniref:Outer envelope pore protein 24A, chloroplastic n=1 Tax=Rhodamnia argentea TaxID=178133 RepID=A0A8B8MML0_9MYRT|nr:outer envelope pore protein 24A, chloroplastic [Rhodamnia argentea]